MCFYERGPECHTWQALPLRLHEVGHWREDRRTHVCLLPPSLPTCRHRRLLFCGALLLLHCEEEPLFMEDDSCVKDALDTSWLYRSGVSAPSGPPFSPPQSPLPSKASYINCYFHFCDQIPGKKRFKRGRGSTTLHPQGVRGCNWKRGGAMMLQALFQ